MKTIEKIETLKNQVKEANTANAEERQLIANSCKELYSLIEDGLQNKYGYPVIADAYEDLCEGNFDEPFYCEQKKGEFELYARIYINNIHRL